MKIFTRNAYWVTIALFLLATNLYAQTTITISPGTNWTDACLLKGNNPIHSFYANTNYSTYSRIAANAWTSSGYPFYRRSLVKFNLSSIPAGSTIQSATLFLYSDPAITSTSAADGNSKLSGSNAVYFEKVTANWGETTVTWNNQPASTITGRIWHPASTSTTENIQVNITSFVRSWVNSPATNYGMRMKLENELHYRSRNYASENHANTAIRPKLVISYTPPISSDPDPIKDRMDYVFGGLDQSFINTGILTDYGIDLTDHTIFDGTIRTDNELDMNNWRTLYGSLLSSVINPSSNMIHLKTINQRLETYWAGYNRNNPIVDLPTLFIKYQSLRSDAISENLISVNNDRLADVPDRPASPYTTAYAFASAPNLDIDDDGDVTFMFRSSLFINSSSKTFSSFQVDFDNGAGYQTMTFDAPKNIIYNTAGSKTLKFKIQFTDGSIYYSHAKFHVQDVSGGAAQARYDGSGHQAYTFPRSQDSGCPESFPNPQTWQNSLYGASVTVEYGSIGGRPAPGCDPQFIRPFIVVEGFDASKFDKFNLENYNFFDFINGEINGGIDVIVGSGLSFGDELEVAGYDLIFVDFNEGTGDIIRNAYLVENIIQWVNAHKITNPHTGVREENVVLGQSMGGMVARYAVCDLEKRWSDNPTTNPNHEVRLLVTHDAPHRGANVPLGFQALVNDMAPYMLTKIGLASYGLVGHVVGSFLEMRDVVPALDQADQLLDEPASRQMLVVQDGRTNTFLEGAYRNMVTFTSGYTPSFTMRALSNGSECGEGQLIAPGDELFYADANLFVNRLLLVSVANGGSSSIRQKHGPLAVISRVGLHVLVPFLGRNWKTKYIVRAASSSGVNQVFYGNISIEKKVLFFIPVNINLFNSSQNSLAGTLPWDAAPGGYYDLQDFKASFPNDPNINAYPIVKANLTLRMAPSFNFVSTVSALDITADPIPLAALSSPFTDGFSPSYPSRFSNFISQEQNNNEVIGSVHNSRHIQFTARNAEWLFNEMENIAGNNLNCSDECQPDGIIVEGSETICENETYTINELPAGHTISWARSSNLIYVSGQNTLNYTVRVGSSTGQPWVEARLNGPCGVLAYRKNLVRGSDGIDFSDITIVGPNAVCPNEWYVFNAYNQSEIPVVEYTWIWPSSGWTILEQNDEPYSCEVIVRAPSQVSGGGGVDLAVVNACGAYQPDWYHSIEPHNACRTYSFNMYPNPVDEYFEISETTSSQNLSVSPEDSDNYLAGEELNGETSTSFKIKALKLYNDMLQEVRSIPFKGPLTRVDTQELPSGHYILHIIGNEGIDKKHVFIQRDN